jgi:uncharacterized phage-associated protein
MVDTLNLKIRSEAIANRIINSCVKNGIKDITNMKIQKLLYYVYGYYYVKHQTFLFDPKYIMFWQHGPVVPTVYDSLKHFKYKVINEYIEDIFPNEENGEFAIVDINNDSNVDNILDSIDSVIKKIGHKTASELRDLSHSEKSVWNKITLTEDGNRNCGFSTIKSRRPRSVKKK